MFIALTAFVCGFVVVQFILKPVEKFVAMTKANPVLRPILEENPQIITKKDEMDHIKHVFKQVTEALNKVDSRLLFPEFTCESRSMRSVLNMVMKVAPTESTVLILGESGTGKELVATSIFQHSKRKNKPFIKLNCVAIPEELLESELFGHEKGAFTGADAKKKGKFELADNGTIFLDEIGDMPFNLQAKLLRVLQEKEFDTVGGTTPVKVDVRVIAATNKNLESLVKEGTFREDLYYRLNVFLITLPPLRERQEDIPLLIEDKINQLKNGDSTITVSDDAMKRMKYYSWPGNIRELHNTIERACVLSENGRLEVNHLPSTVDVDTIQVVKKSKSILDEETTLDEKLQEIEVNIISDALKRTEGIQVKAAELLGINQRSLWHRMKKYDIDATKFKKTTTFDDKSS
ncbi:MAG: sigma-54 dependent transcriptional regulator [Proteobacteria bacterium]|nr:sigma-54 dependent transcriptional regulator [Pseudomonadota bacterium]